MFKGLIQNDISSHLVIPMVVNVFYIFGLGVLSFFARVSAIRNREVPRGYFKAISGDAPERVHILGRHFDNQFQLPLLFLIGCCAHLAIREVSQFTVALAWIFIATRVVHSYIHLGYNKVTHRFIAYFTGFFVILLLYGQLAYFALKNT